jgi:hypothetical protein
LVLGFLLLKVLFSVVAALLMALSPLVFGFCTSA